MPRMYNKVPGTTLHKRLTLRGTRESNYFFLQEQLYKNTEAEMGQKTRAS